MMKDGWALLLTSSSFKTCFSSARGKLSAFDQGRYFMEEFYEFALLGVGLTMWKEQQVVLHAPETFHQQST